MLGFESFENSQTVENIKSALQNRFPQTILITGAEGSGKSLLANTVAAALLCTSAHKKPCGVCASCQKVENGFHPDLQIIDYGENEIPVAVSRELRKSINILPNDGDRRVVIIKHAQRLNIPAQNALLKVLEEPPQYAFFILTSEQSGEILETIRSRCTKYNLAPSRQEKELDDLSVEKAEGFLRALAQADEYNMLLNSMSLEKLSKAEICSVCSVIQTALRDCIFIANGLSDRLLSDIGQPQLAGRVSTERLLKLYDFIDVLCKRIKGNAAQTIVCADLCAGAYSICFM